MCNQCHQHLRKDEILRQLKEGLENPQYEQWNKTSVNHIFISLSNYDGQECKNLAKQNLEGFLKWYETNKDDCYMPSQGIQNMYSKQTIKNVLTFSKENNNLEHEEFMRQMNEII